VFQLPEDIFLEPAYWANTGELDQIEKDEVSMLANVTSDSVNMIR